MLNEVKEETQQKMHAAIDSLKKELACVRTGRASLALLDNVTVDYYGTPSPISQVATLSIPEARLICIQPWEGSMIQPIEKAIMTSNLGLSPNNDGKIIRLPIPALTEERRAQMVKQIKNTSEETKVSIRSKRRDAIEDLKSFEKEKEISEDDLHRGQEQIQKLTDVFVEKINDLVAAKEKELMTV